MPVGKELIYPIFLKCAEFAPDAFWETIFEDLAYAKSPYGTYISKDFLCCGYKGKEFSYKIEKKDPRKMHDEIYNLLNSKLGLLSQKEKMRKRIDFHTMEDSIKKSRQNWGTIRKKNVKELLIEKYVLAMRKKHELNISQAKTLLSIIFIAMVFKIIVAKDIDYRDGMIHNIDGISFEKGSIVMDRDIYSTEPTIVPQIVMDKKLMSDNWEKYIQLLEKMEMK